MSDIQETHSVIKTYTNISQTTHNPQNLEGKESF